MRRTAAVLLFAAACGAAACGSSSSSTPATAPASTTAPASADDEAARRASAAPPGQRPLDEDLATLVAQAVAMFETVGDELAASGTDCAAATKRLQALRGRYDGLITAARKVETDGRGPEIERLLEPHQARIQAAVEKMRPNVEACLSNPEFARAFEELTGGGTR